HDRTNVTVHLAVVAAQRNRIALEPNDRAVGSQKAEFRFRRGAMLQGVFPAGEHALTVFRMDRASPAFAHRVLSRHAGHSAPTFIDEDVVALHIGLEDAHRRMARERAKAGLAIAQRNLAFLPLGNIQCRAQQSHRPAVLADDRSVAEQPDVLAVRMYGAELNLQRRILFNRVLNGLLHPRTALRMHDRLNPFVLRDVGRDDAQDALQRLGPGDAVAFDVPGPDADFAGLRRQQQPSLAFSQRLLGDFALSNIDADARYADDLAFAVAKRKLGGEKMSLAAPPRNDVLGFQRLAGPAHFQAALPEPAG